MDTNKQTQVAYSRRKVSHPAFRGSWHCSLAGLPNGRTAAAAPSTITRRLWHCTDHLGRNAVALSDRGDREGAPRAPRVQRGPRNPRGGLPPRAGLRGHEDTFAGHSPPPKKWLRKGRRLENSITECSKKASVEPRFMLSRSTVLATRERAQTTTARLTGPLSPRAVVLRKPKHCWERKKAPTKNRSVPRELPKAVPRFTNAEEVSSLSLRTGRRKRREQSV